MAPEDVLTQEDGQEQALSCGHSLHQCPSFLFSSGLPEPPNSFSDLLFFFFGQEEAEHSVKAFVI